MKHQVDFLELLQIDYEKYPVIAVVGGGGKTSLIYRLTDELIDKGKKVIITTTTHMAGESELPFAKGGDVVQVKELLEVILHVMEENVETYMPGFTHLQKAQPITLAHHMGAYFEMFRRDHERLKDISKRMNTCPLGSGALAGTTYPLDREYTAELLGFDGPTLNSMDGVSDRDYLLELLSALSIMMMHLSRF